MTSRPLEFHALPMAALLAVSGCSGERVESLYGEIGVVYTDADGQRRTGRAATIDYGSVLMGQTVARTIQVQNMDRGAVTLRSLEVLDGADAIRVNGKGADSPVWSVTFPAGKVLKPSEVVDLTVEFSPPVPQGQAVQEREHDVTLALRATEARPGEGTATIRLSGRALWACLTIAPDALDFGMVKVGCASATRTFSVYNTCSAPVAISGFRIRDAPPDDPSCVSSPGCEFLLPSVPAFPAGGLPIAPGGPPTTFDVRYAPVDFGRDASAISIGAVQNTTRVKYVVPLQGGGDAHGLQTDTFVQDTRPKADILLVVDNSGSMGDKQQSLANFASFFKYAHSAQVDYHFAVTTTDMTATGARGRLVSGPTHPEKVLTPTTPDVENKFNAKVKVGISGSAWEQGAEPALRALTAPLIHSDNAGFLRDEAALAVVVVTDEDDQSPGAMMDYLNQLWNVKGHNRKTKFTFSAIAAFTSPVFPCTGIVETGEYAFYAAQTNGVTEDICTPDWGRALENLGKKAFGFRTNFFLTSEPDLSQGPLDVRIDQQPVAPSAIGGATIWTYDPVANSVNFDPAFVPRPGQTLTITYHVFCHR